MNPTPSPSTSSYQEWLIWGIPWDGDALAAVLAGGIALATLLWTLAAFFLTRHRLSAFESRSLELQTEVAVRDQHRLQLNDGIGYALGKSEESQQIGLTLLEELKGAAWATDDDRLRVAAVLNAIGVS